MIGDGTDNNRAQWLQERRKSIGGSDAAAIIGLNRYTTPYVVWADKTGLLPEKEDTEAMRQGRDLEEYVAKRFTKSTGKSVRRNNSIIRNPKYPFAHANIDRQIVGERAGLECKTTSIMNMKRFKNGDYPEEYYCQCVHYMAVTGYDKWYLAVLILNQGFMVFEIERDEDEIGALMEAEKAFWEAYVLKNVPPPMDGKPATTEAVNHVFRTESGGEADISHLYPDIENLQALKSQIKALNEQAEKIEQEIRQSLSDSDTGHCGRFTVTWRNQTRRTLDKKLLQASNPLLDLSPYEKSTSYRVFKIKEEEE